MQHPIIPSIDYGIYIGENKASIVSEDQILFQTDIPADEDKARQTLNCCTAIFSRIKHPFRILIFGPTPMKYALYMFIDSYPTPGYTVKEVFVSPDLEDDDIIAFTKRHFDLRISL